MNKSPYMSDLAVRLSKLVTVDPTLMLGILYVLPAPQWKSIVDQSAYRELCTVLTKLTARPLRQWHLEPETHGEDVSLEVLLKLGLGRFLKRYVPERKHPRSYLLGCARNLARVEARSIWRLYRKERQHPARDE